MKKFFLILLILPLFINVSCRNDEIEKVVEDPINDIQQVPLGDPFIMLYEGTYYAYGTHGNDGIEVYTSNDLETWEGPLGVNNGFALHKNDVWNDRWFWAPEIYFVNNKFYMYYSADEHICVATSDSPLGPFIQESIKPMIEDEKCIDNSLFIDDDGTPYMTYVRFNDGNNIWIAELENNLKSIKTETITKCLHVSQPWEEVWPRVNEGSFITKHNGLYYMSYSANSYESQFYGVGFATATNLLGPWEKYEENPILQKPVNLVGVGHSAMFNDKNGDLRIVFHAHKSETEIHPRYMHIGTVYFETIDGMDIMKIGDEILTPTLTN